MPTRDKRFGWGWIALGAILVLLIGSSLAVYFGRNPDESVLRQYLLQSRIEMLTASKDTMADELLEAPLERLRPQRGVSTRSALYYLVMNYEKTGQVDRVAAEKLANSSSREARAVAEIYRSAKISPDRARRLSALLGDELVAYQLAAHHAKRKAGLVRDDAPDSGGGLAIGFWISVIGRLLLMLLGGCLLIGYLVVRLSGQVSVLGSPAGVLSRADADRYAMRTFQILFIYVGAQVALVLIFRDSIAQEWLLLATMGLILLFTFVLYPVWPIGGKKLSLARLGFRTDHLGHDILWGIGTGIAGFALLILPVIVIWLFPDLPPPEQPVTFDLDESRSLLAMTIFFFMAVIAAPLWEEVCFRGLMLPAMSTVFGSVGMGIFVSSLCFAAIHTTGIPAWPTLGGVGALGAILTYQRKSLVPAIIMHATYNGLQVLMQVLMF